MERDAGREVCLVALPRVTTPKSVRTSCVVAVWSCDGRPRRVGSDGAFVVRDYSGLGNERMAEEAAALSRWAVVTTLVCDTPGSATAYGVWVAAEARYRGVLHLDRGRVGKLLPSLSRDGLVEQIRRGGDRSAWRVKEHGASRWRTWLQSDITPTSGVGGEVAEIRRVFRARMCSVRRDDPQTMLHIIDRYAQAVRRAHRPLAPDGVEPLVEQVLADHDDRYVAATLSWCEDARLRILAEIE